MTLCKVTLSIANPSLLSILALIGDNIGVFYSFELVQSDQKSNMLYPSKTFGDRCLFMS